MENIQKFIDVLIEREGLLDKEARTTVGLLCASIDALTKTQSFNPAVFKELAKNTVYNQSRVLKKLLQCMVIPKIRFVSDTSKEK